MKILTTKIEVSGVSFTFCNTVEIVTGFEQLTDTISMVIPKKLSFVDSSGRPIQNITKGKSAIFKNGDEIKVSLGYDGNTEDRFLGAISGVKLTYPLEITGADKMSELKKKTYTKSLKNPSLKELLDEIIPKSVKLEITADQNLGDFRITNATASQVLDELRSKHGIFSFFRDGVLYVGLAIVPKLQKTVRFNMFKDIIDPNSMEYVEADDKKIKIIAKSIQDDNTLLEYEAGDADGETRTLYFTNIKDLKDLEKKAKASIDPLKYSGFNGDFTTFLTPAVNHGDIVEIINSIIPEQSGGYICKKNVISSGVAGGRQKITLYKKVYSLALSGDQYVKTDINAG